MSSTDAPTGARVAVLGSINLDSVIRVGHLPRPGETVAGSSYRRGLGGKGANQAVAASRSGAAASMIGQVGSDGVGHDLRQRLAVYGVCTEHVQTVADQHTGVAHILVSDDGENCIALSTGANGSLTEVAEPAVDVIQHADVLLLQLELPIEVVIDAAAHAHRGGVPVILTPAPAARLPRQLLDLVDVIVPNAVELEQVTGTADVEVACRKLVDAGVSVLATLGDRGSIWRGLDGLSHHVPALRVRAVDTTGAGDCFTGAFAARWAATGNILEAMLWATAAAALSVQHVGAAESIPGAEAIEHALAATQTSTKNKREGMA